jgi:hypothetical protein
MGHTGPAKPDEIPEGSHADVYGRFVPGANHGPGWTNGYPPDQKAAIKAKFLAEYERTFSQRKACQLAQINRRTLQLWRKADPEFDAAWTEAYQNCVDRMEETLFEVATNRDGTGTVAPKDQITAAIMVLNAHREGYRQREAPGSGATQINFIFGKPGDPPALPPPPRQLPSLPSGDVIDLDAQDDALEGD